MDDLWSWTILMQKNETSIKKTLSKDCTPTDIDKYKEFRNIYNKTKKELKQNYYWTRCIEYKCNAKKLWGLINDTIKKVKHKGSIIPYIMVDGLQQYNPCEIANCFRKFYSNLGPELASKVLPGTTTVSTYINNIPRRIGSMVLNPTTVQEINVLIKNLPNKSSHSHDNISNIMLKSLRPSITYPLCHIFNTSLMEGMFPSKMPK